MTKICKYCGDEYSGKSFYGCCCIEEGRILKSEMNASYYAKNRQIVLAEKYAGMLEACIRQFGEGSYFDASILGQMKFDWSFSKKEIQVGQNNYRVIKNYAYILYKNQKIKIIYL